MKNFKVTRFYLKKDVVERDLNLNYSEDIMRVVNFFEKELITPVKKINCVEDTFWEVYTMNTEISYIENVTLTDKNVIDDMSRYYMDTKMFNCRDLVDAMAKFYKGDYVKIKAEEIIT